MKTPEQLEQLKNGHFDEHHHTIFVRPEAHPNILSEAKHLADSKFKEIILTDKQENTINLHPRTHHVQARFDVGGGSYFHLPTNYVSYSIDSGYKIDVTNAELDSILQWKNIVYLDIRDRSNVANGLMHRVEQMKELNGLRTLVLRVQRDSYGLFDVKPFLEQLPTLRSFTIIADTLNKTELNEFFGQHGEFNHWKRSTPLLMKRIVYEKSFDHLSVNLRSHWS